MLKDILLNVLAISFLFLAIYGLYKYKKELLFKMALNYCQEAEIFFNSKEGQQKLSYVVKKIRDHLPFWLDPLVSEKFLNNIIHEALSYLQDLFKSSKDKQIAVVNEIIKLSNDNIKTETKDIILNEINQKGYVEAYANVKTDLHGKSDIQAGVKATVKF